MKAWVVRQLGGPESMGYEDVDAGVPADGMVRISIRASGINYFDALMVAGQYQSKPELPFVPGVEISGEILHAPEKSGFEQGQRVSALLDSGGLTRGGYAEIADAAPAAVQPLPGGMPFDEAAAFTLIFQTAWFGLHRRAAIKPEEILLVHAGAGGVGSAAIQLGKAAGATVIATAGTDEKVEVCKRLGATHAINYKAQDFAEEVRRITGGEGVDVIMDALGPTSFRKDYRILRPGGRLIMYGASEVQTGTGKRDMRTALRSLARMPTATMPWWKSLGVMNENKGVFGLNMLSWWDREGSVDRLTEPLLDGLAKGDLMPVVAEAFPFDRAPDAHRFIEERRNIGKVVLVPTA